MIAIRNRQRAVAVQAGFHRHQQRFHHVCRPQGQVGAGGGVRDLFVAHAAQERLRFMGERRDPRESKERRRTFHRVKCAEGGIDRFFVVRELFELQQLHEPPLL